MVLDVRMVRLRRGEQRFAVRGPIARTSTTEND